MRFWSTLAMFLALQAQAAADETFSVQPQQEVSIGGTQGDTFIVDNISPADGTVTVLVRPKGEDCLFRFPLHVGRSVRLRTVTLDGEVFLCSATLRPLVGSDAAQFSADCVTFPGEPEAARCPPSGEVRSNAE